MSIAHIALAIAGGAVAFGILTILVAIGGTKGKRRNGPYS